MPVRDCTAAFLLAELASKVILLTQAYERCFFQDAHLQIAVVVPRGSAALLVRLQQRLL